MTRMTLHPGATNRLLQTLALCLLVFGAALCAVAPARAEDAPATESLKITDPYLELHTGPGRGYPIFFVVARDELVDVQLRFTDWYKVRTVGGQEGWVHRRQLVSTLTAAGATKSFRELALDDYLQRKVEFGGAWGQFKAEPMLKFWVAYKFSEALGVEATLGQVQGVFSGTSFWHVNLQTEPWADQRISPFFAIGVGNFRNFPNSSLVAAVPTTAQLANASVGVRYHLSERFMLRADYSIYTAFLNETRSGEYRAFTGGLSFFF